MRVKNGKRTTLSRDRIVATAVALADAEGLESVSMRRLGTELRVDPMAVYNHIANKDELLDAMADHVVAKIEVISGGGDWRPALRAQVLRAREVLRQHRWAPAVIESRRAPSLATARYYDAVIGMLRSGGFSLDLIHHSLHAMGSRLLGFTQELFDDTGDADGAEAEILSYADQLPNLVAMMALVLHDDESVVGSGCDDQHEFEFALDLLLDGLEARRAAEAPD